MKDALKLALEALEYASTGNRRPEVIGAAITAIKQALAAPVQEPVAFKQFLFDVHTAAGLVTHGKQCKALGERLGEGVMRYMETPPAAQRQWVGLTDEEIVLICGECAASAHRHDDISYARAIEAKLKEKNT